WWMRPVRWSRTAERSAHTHGERPSPRRMSRAEQANSASACESYGPVHLSTIGGSSHQACSESELEICLWPPAHPGIRWPPSTLVSLPLHWCGFSTTSTKHLPSFTSSTPHGHRRAIWCNGYGGSIPTSESS